MITSPLADTSTAPSRARSSMLRASTRNAPAIVVSTRPPSDLAPILELPLAARLTRRLWPFGIVGVVMAMAAAGTWFGSEALWDGKSPGGEPNMGALAVMIGSFAVMALGAMALLFFGAIGGERARAVRIAVTARGLHLDGVLVAGRRSLTAGHLVANDGKGSMVVEIHRRFRRMIRLVVPTYDEARALLTALGLDATQRDAVFRTASRITLHGWIGLVLILGVFGAEYVGFRHGLGAALALADVSLLLVYGALAIIPSTLHVGADGLRIHWVGYRRSIAYRDLAAIDDECLISDDLKRRSWRLVFRLRSGGRVQIPVGGWGLNHELNGKIIREAAYHDAQRRPPPADRASRQQTSQRPSRPPRRRSSRLRRPPRPPRTPLQNLKAPHGGGTPVILASGQNRPDALALYGSHVYWTTYGAGGTSAVRRVHK